MFDAGLTEVVRRDPRFAYEAYEFVFEALSHTQKLLGRTPPEPPPRSGTAEPQLHVSGRELLDGIRDLALREFGRLACVVCKLWGVHCTADFGDIVFNLVEAGLMSKTDRDCRADFQDVFDLETTLQQDFRIELDEAL